MWHCDENGTAVASLRREWYCCGTAARMILAYCCGTAMGMVLLRHCHENGTAVAL